MSEEHEAGALLLEQELKAAEALIEAQAAEIRRQRERWVRLDYHHYVCRDHVAGLEAKFGFAQDPGGGAPSTTVVHLVGGGCLTVDGSIDVVLALLQGRS